MKKNICLFSRKIHPTTTSPWLRLATLIAWLLVHSSAIWSFAWLEKAEAEAERIKLGSCYLEFSGKYERHQADTIRNYLKAAEKKIDTTLKEQPHPPHISFLEERELAKSWKGENGPQAFEAFLPDGLSFVSTPDVNAEKTWGTKGPVVAMRLSPEGAGMAHVDFVWEGKKASTRVYFTKPIMNTREIIQKSHKYLIGPENKVVYLRIHGGGTPSAVAGTASSLASFMLKHGIPTLAFDQQQHGRGLREPLLSMDEQIDMNLALMDQLVHPDVKIIFDGHSWGGEAALQAWRNSDDPRFDRVVAFIAESPPGDVTLGGSSRERLLAELEIEKQIIKSKTLVAEADWEFLANIIRNMKVSLVAPWATDLTFRSYSWDPLPPERVAKLKPLMVVVGEHDGLVYVQREQAFDEYLRKNIPPDRYIVLGPGRNFRNSDSKSPLVRTGHQISDKYIDGTEKPEVFNKELDFVSQVTGLSFPEMPIITPDSPEALVYKLFLLYSNNFAAQQYLSRHVEYSRRPTPEVIARQERAKSIARLFERRTTLISDFNRQTSPFLETKIKELNQKYEIKGGKHNAERELTVDHSPARRAELNAYLEKIKQAEEDFRQNFVDNETPLARERAVKEYGEELTSIAEDVVDLRNLQKNIVQIEKSSASTTLKEERLHHLLIENNHRFDERSPLGEQVQAKIDSLLELRPATAPSKSEEDFVRIRANAEQKVITWKKQRNRRFGEGLTKAHATVPAPRNIQRPSDALWELSVNEMSPERRSQLLEYLAKYTTYLEKETQLRQTAFDRKLTQWDEEELAKLLGSDFNSLVMNSASDSNFAPGENIYSEERVRYRQGVMSSLEGELYTIGQIMEDRFIPPFTEQSASQETLKRIVDQRTVIKLQIEELGSELKSILKSLEDFKGKRKELVKKIEPLMNRGSSQRLSEVIEEGEVLLGVAEKAFENFRNDIIEAIVGLEESGSLTKDNLLAKIAEFSDKEQDFARDKQSFRDQLDLISSVRLEEAALGQLVSELDTSGTRLQAFLQKLIGNYTRSESGITPSESSIEGRIQEAQSARDRILDMLDLKKREWHELGIEIANSAPLGPDQSGNKFVNYYKVSIPWLLNRPLEDLLTMLHEGEMASVYMEALRATLINWESSEMWRSVLQQQDDPNHGWYELELK